ncbi:MAG: cyclic di-GMP phosphodiesterase [Thermoleophilaceae bacterium]|jgi:putative two-component system response regulator|nr:cyclic di-GMP phosphodiesterase [Thermoleophilaceae bacterium]
MTTRPDATWARILIVDDQPPNVILLERMLEQWGYTDVTGTTQSQEVPNLCATLEPDLLLLDLQMPKPDGFELMEILAPRIQGSPRMPVLVLTADITTATRQRALGVGASDFLSKPVDPMEVRLRIANLLETRRLEREMLGQNQLLEGHVRERTADLERARLELLERLALAAEYRDDNTQEHAQRVGRTTALLAVAVGVPAADVEVLLRAAPLHDIGKIGVPDAILLKSASLTDAEYAVMQAHTTIGAEILSGSEFAILRTAEVIAATHHERWDGAGYPKGIAGDEIPLAGRLVAVADVFDALVHERPYKPAWPLERALEEIRSLGGTHFDPDVVAAFDALDHGSLLDPIAHLGPEPAAVAAIRR